MEKHVSLGELDEFAKQCINAQEYPECDHYFKLYSCHSCGGNEFRITVEHHTGSEEWDFKGIVQKMNILCINQWLIGISYLLMRSKLLPEGLTGGESKIAMDTL